MGYKAGNIFCTNAVVATLLLLSLAANAFTMVGLLVKDTFPLTSRLPLIKEEENWAKVV